MRLSEWQARAPTPEAMGTKVLAVLEPVLAALGAPRDPESWVSWGDDPGRYAVLAVTPAGLAIVNVRVNVPQEGPRAGGKLVRWSRLQLGELDVESQSGHRIASVQLEGQVLRGVDEAADRVSGFVLQILAAIDGRPLATAAGTGRSSPTSPSGELPAGAPAKAATAQRRRGGEAATR